MVGKQGTGGLIDIRWQQTHRFSRFGVAAISRELSGWLGHA
jgi:hypothetical protein